MDKLEIIALSQVKVNAENPRTITGEKFQKLVNSILVFPKMLEIRPIVINNQYVALGGNMRTNALNFIARMELKELTNRLEQQRDYNKMTEGEKKVIVKHWTGWLKKPVAHIIKAEQLSPSEQQQFIIKDNVSFGSWDFDELANKFDEKDLGDWGMDVWQPMSFESAPTTSAPANPVQPQYPADSEDDGVGVVQNLDEVLDGLKAESFQSIIRGESDLFSATFTFDKQYFDLIKKYIDGVTKAVISDEIIKMAQEYDATHPDEQATEE